MSDVLLAATTIAMTATTVTTTTTTSTVVLQGQRSSLHSLAMIMKSFAKFLFNDRKPGLARTR